MSKMLLDRKTETQTGKLKIETINKRRLVKKNVPRQEDETQTIKPILETINQKPNRKTRPRKETH